MYGILQLNCTNNLQRRPVSSTNILSRLHITTRRCNCIHCNQPMQLRTRPTKDTSDGFGFRCINGNCSKRLTIRSIRAGSFFEKSRVPLAKWLYFLYLWCQDTMVKKAAETTGISKRTTLQVYQYIRDICTTKLLHN